MLFDNYFFLCLKKKEKKKKNKINKYKTKLQTRGVAYYAIELK